ncbi:MAG: 5-carboxyvanillate decarboxylase [Betaproteobacteria bacterium]|nr:5-carboxyvanillate decarboxylase [Betaproteobacteria bacterium]
MIRIAAEEAWAPREILDRYRQLLAEKPESWDPGFRSLWGFFLGSTERATSLVSRIQDLGSQRIADMDATGIAKQLVFLSSPGVQVFDAATAASLSVRFNDELAEKIRANPSRFAGLAAIAPHAPADAARELERSVKSLGLKGAVVNSHTQGEYLDDPKCWEIFEAAQALDVPIYIHPNTPPRDMIGPFLPRGLDGAIYGFAVETGLHLLRIVVAGVFDRFPKLRVVVGHLGEGLPFWLFRLDFMHASMVRAERYPGVKPLQRKLSEYFKENIWVTTSGMQWQPAILFAISVLGIERVMYAMDYPYQFVPDEVKVTDGLPISAADRKKLYQDNVERVFKLT